MDLYESCRLFQRVADYFIQNNKMFVILSKIYPFIPSFFFVPLFLSIFILPLFPSIFSPRFSLFCLFIPFVFVSFSFSFCPFLLFLPLFNFLFFLSGYDNCCHVMLLKIINSKIVKTVLEECL